MSQGACIYRITAKAFEAANTDPDNFRPYNNCVDFEIFHSTHEGLKYILSRNQSEENTRLVSEIFYPRTQIGEIDFDKEDLDVEDFERIISYLEPQKVKVINFLLQKMGEDFFKENFKPDEMNKEGIYPHD